MQQPLCLYSITNKDNDKIEFKDLNIDSGDRVKRNIKIKKNVKLDKDSNLETNKFTLNLRDKTKGKEKRDKNSVNYFVSGDIKKNESVELISEPLD